MATPEGSRLRRLGWGFALSGGGAKGAYCAGVVRAFETAGVFGDDLAKVHAVHGVSTGALVASMVALGKFKELEELYTTVTTRDILRPSRRLAYRFFGIEGALAFSAAFGPPHIFETKPLRKLVREVIGADRGFERILELKDRVDVGFTSVNLESGEVRTYGNRNAKDAPSLEDALLASTNQPVLMDLVSIDGKQHGDGGVREFLPVAEVVKSPFADRIDVVVSVPLAEPKPRPTEGKLEKLTEVLERTVSILSYDVGDSDLKGAQFVDALLRVRQGLAEAGQEQLWEDLRKSLTPYVQRFLERDKVEAFQFIKVQPERLDFEDSLEFDPKEMKPAFEQGHRDGEKALERWWDDCGHACEPKASS